jgi:SPP1 gp7 family putative phage head morphogenesis protein
MKPVPFDQAIEWANRRGVVLPDRYYGTLQGIARSQAFSIAGLGSLAQLQAILDSLNAYVASGQTFRDWQKDVNAGKVPLTLPAHRLDNIFRTNIQSAYNGGRWTQQAGAVSIRPYLMYDAVNDSRVRPAHLAMDNLIRPADDPFWRTRYPPNGYRCRCIAISLTKKQADRRGGVSSSIPLNAEPDEGWDYNPGLEPIAGIQKAKQKAILTGNPTLVKAMLAKPEPEPPPPPAPRQFVPAANKGAAIARLEAFIRTADAASVGRYGYVNGVDLPGATLDQLNSILRGVEKSLGAYDHRVGTITWTKKRTSALGVYRRWELIDFDSIEIQKTAAKSAKKNAQEGRDAFARQKQRRIEYLQAAIADPARANLKDRSEAELRNVLASTRWAVFHDADDPLASVLTHEGFHRVYRGSDFENTWASQLSAKSIKEDTIRGVSEYAGKNRSEFFAELMAADAEGFELSDEARGLVDWVKWSMKK